MMNRFLATKEYRVFIDEIKRNIQIARNKAIRSVNSELIGLYYFIGEQITKGQQDFSWGDDFIGQVEIDLKISFPQLSGFSRRNLNYMRTMYCFFGKNEKMPQLVAQIPWGHIRLILDKIKDVQAAEFYIQKTIENSWSRVTLEHQIALRLFERQGKMTSNFDATLEGKDIVLIQESFKENYVLDFLGVEESISERDLEALLIKNITHLILELGRGFAFVGRQYKLTVGMQEFFVDLLFYNFILKRFVVIELKTTEFKPEYVGQVGLYITAIDRGVKVSGDGGTIGLIVCRSKDNTVVEYALANSSQPTGVAEYKLFSELPKEIQKCLPTENELNSLSM